MRINNKIIILGNSAAIPKRNRHLSSQVAIFANNYFLIDCGEGTQMQLINLGIKYHKIDNIFISHLHGDHFFGLIGLISTYHLLGRVKPLTIYSPPGLEEIIRLQLKISHSKLNFQLIFNELIFESKISIYQNDKVEIFAFPLDHKVPCYGYFISEKLTPLNIKKSFIKTHNPTVKQIISIKNGADFVCNNGNILKNSEITKKQHPASYAYCSDTKYNDDIPNYVKNVSLLYHEATFDNSLIEKAYEKFHSTASQAAMCALKANAKKLILGHFSARKIDTNTLLSEATEIFPNTTISEEGVEYRIP